MSLLLPTALLVIVFVVIAMAGSEGLWSNAITLVNVVTAALLATNFWEPVADLLIEQFPQGTYLWDFSALWGLFAVGLIVLRTATLLPEAMTSPTWMRMSGVCSRIMVNIAIAPALSAVPPGIGERST